jgi:hypothetical protein
MQLHVELQMNQYRYVLGRMVKSTGTSSHVGAVEDTYNGSGGGCLCEVLTLAVTQVMLMVLGTHEPS